MVNTRVFLITAFIFVFIIMSLLVALNEQRNLIYLSPSSGTEVTFPSGETLGTWGSVWAQDVSNENTLYVSGSATASDNPDKVTIQFSIETEDNSALVSQQENAQVTASVRAALTGKGILDDSISTTGYSLSQIREYNSATRKYEYKGFKTVHSMKAELTEIGRAGEIIDAVVSAGANRINQVYFGLSDAKLHTLRMQALKSAAENSWDRAESIASGLGVTITKVRSATESYSYSPVYRSLSYDLAAGAEAEPAATTQITPGDIRVTATVSVIFEIA